MTATNRDGSLHQFDGSQVRALTALAGGATQEVAAQTAGVHRITVTRWTNHHPAFIAEPNRLHSEAAAEAREAMRRVTRAALTVVEAAIEDGNVDAAFRWLRLGPLPCATTPPSGPVDSDAVVADVRVSTSPALEALLADLNGMTTAEAESLIVRPLNGSK